MMNVSLDGKDLVAVVDDHSADADHVVRVRRYLALLVRREPLDHGQYRRLTSVVEGEAAGD